MPRVLPVLLMLAFAAPAGASTAIPVTTTADVIANDGQCSLREAVISSNTDAANPTDCVNGGPTDDYLTLGAGTYTLAIGGAGEDGAQTGDLDVHAGMRITGQGMNATIIDAAGLDRALDVTGPDGSLDLFDLEITGGRAPDAMAGDPANVAAAGEDSTGGDGAAAVLDGAGGGIRTSGFLSLTRVRMSDNRAGDGGAGAPGGAGGPGGDGQVGGASTGGIGGTGGDGGAIYAERTVTLTDSVLSANQAGTGGAGGAGGLAGAGGSEVGGGDSVGGRGGFGGSGGALYLDGSGLVASGTLFEGNHAGAGGAAGDGGAAGAGGDGLVTGGSGGTSTGGSGVFGGSGGAVYGSVADLTITTSTFRANTGGAGGKGGNGAGGGDTGAAPNPGLAGLSDGGPGGPGGAYGAIFTDARPTQISASLFVGNAGGGGGDGGAAGTAGTGVNRTTTGGQGGFGGAAGALGQNDEGGTLTNVTLTQNEGGRGGAGGAGGNGPGSSLGGDGGSGAGNAGIAQSSALEALTLLHVTLAGNQPGLGGTGGASTTAQSGSDGTAGTSGIAIADFGGNVHLQNSIVANGADNCTGAITDGGHNVTFPGDDSDCASGSHADPLLGALGDHSCRVQAMLIGVTSPARDLVPASGAQCPAKDARGLTRPVGAACDAGAIELWPVSAIATTAATGVTASGATLNGTVTPGLQTLVHFEYGTDTSYGTRSPDTPVSQPSAVTFGAGALAPNTTYHYRLVAAGTDGSAAGDDMTFTTPASPVQQPPGGSNPPPAKTFAGVTIKGGKVTVSKNRAPIALICPAATEGACTGTITLTAKVKVKRKIVTIRAGSARIAIQPGKTVTVKVKLGKKALKALKRSLKVTVAVAAHDGAGRSATTGAKVTLRKARKKKR
jgi:CSLREA domain-containing protein